MFLLSLTSGSDVEYCSTPNDNFECTDDWNMKGQCEQVPGAKYQNYNCEFIYGEQINFFTCLNRMDKKNVLFKTPPVPEKKKEKSFNYNELLPYDNKTIFCMNTNGSALNITYEALGETSKVQGDLVCQLQNDNSVILEQLWEDLLVDFTFEMSHKIGEI